MCVLLDVVVLVETENDPVIDVDELDEDEDELLICVELEVVVLVEPGAPLYELDEDELDEDELDPDVLPIALPSSLAINSSK